MGARGPAPKTQQVRDLEGNPGKQPRNDEAPVAKGAARCPAHLDDYAKAVWRRVRESMPPALYAKADTEILAAYCAAASMHRRAVRAIRAEGEVVEGANGPYQSPWVSIQNKQAQLMATLGTRLGLDPAARSTMRVAAKERVKSKFGGLVSIPGGRAG